MAKQVLVRRIRDKIGHLYPLRPVRVLEERVLENVPTAETQSAMRNEVACVATVPIDDHGAQLPDFSTAAHRDGG